MGAMLRSDPMTFCDMYLQPEAAFEIVSHLGELGCVQFVDNNPEVQAFQRNYVTEMCRCAEMERQLRYMQNEMDKDKIFVPEVAAEPKAVQPNETLMLESMLEKWEDDIEETSAYLINLRKNYLQLSEMYYVLSHIGPMLGDSEIRRESSIRKGAADRMLGGHLIVLTGVVGRKRCFAFETMLWRISRGNIYYRQAPEDAILQDPQTGKDIRKVAFLALCQGDELAVRMQKVFSGFRVNTYSCPKTYPDRMEMILKLETRLDDLEAVLKKSRYYRCKALRTVGKQWNMWMIQVRKAKAIYHTLNLFNLDVTKKCLLGQCWVPNKDLKAVQDTLEYYSDIIGTNVPSFMSKAETAPAEVPTYHRTNKFTHAFQALIDAYGESKYKELNPGLYTIITFPFLFAVMFGDIGHGLIVFLFGLWMVVKEKTYMGKKTGSEIWNIFFGGRYVILMLGLFSMYTGFLYNDIFAKSLKLTDSFWHCTHGQSDIEGQKFIDLDPKIMTRFPYIFGIDPAWVLSKNKIMFENSLKMKMSIIIGVLHMLFGIFLSLFNHIYFKQYHLILLQFIPEILFMICVFLWLVFLIIWKFFKYTTKTDDVFYGSFCAPQVLILFIDMMLVKTSEPVDEGCKAYMFGSQAALQMGLLSVALLCVPVLLLGTPIYTYRYNKRKRKEALEKISNFRRYQRTSDRTSEVHIWAEVKKYSVPFSDLMINQGVHTIEYVLSTISHTASYLRLWALSLAHSQLAEMLWVMVLSKLALQDHTMVGIPKLFLVFAIWAAFTLAILVVMEGMSAFLHTLRLHWVEFMSKFFMGGGFPFRPLSFKKLLASEGDKREPACKKRQKI